MKQETAWIIIIVILLIGSFLPKFLFSAAYPPNAIKPIDVNSFSRYWGTIISTYNSDFSHLYVGKVSSEKYRSYVDFDTSPIPDNSIIDSIELHFCVYPQYDELYEPTEYYRGMSTKGYDLAQQGNQQLYEGMGNAPIYNTLTSTQRLWTTQGCKTLILGGTAKQDLKNKLSQNWFSIAFTSSETSSSDDYASIASSSSAQIDIGPYLIVNYHSSCTESWTCTSWTTCTSGTQTRTCTDANACGTTANKPATTQTCSTTCPTFQQLIDYANQWIAGQHTFQELINYANSWASC